MRPQEYVEGRIKSVNSFSDKLFFIFRYSWASVLSVAILFIFLWALDQGRDVLVELGDTLLSLDAFSFFIGTIFLAFLNWYLPYINLRLKSAQSYLEKLDTSGIIKFFPKYLAFLTIIINSHALLHTAEHQWVFGDNTNDAISFSALFGSALLLLFFHKAYDTIIYKWNEHSPRRLKTLFIGLLLATFSPFILHTLTGSKPLFYYILLIFSPAALGLLIYSVLVLFGDPSLKPINNDSKGSNFSYFTAFFQNKSWGGAMNITVIIGCAVAITIWILGNISIPAALSMGPAVSLISTLIALSSLLNYGVYKLIRFQASYKGVAISVGLGLMCCLYTCNIDQKHKVHLVDVHIQEPELRQDASTYAGQWLEELDAICPKDSNIYLVSSYGGGIRAAYWTNLVLARYMDQTDGQFYDQIYSLSGASGGMVGEGVFMSLGKKKLKKTSYHEVVKQFYGKKDFLSPIILRLFGLDLLGSFIPFHVIPDRHRVLEVLFENRLDDMDTSHLFRSSITQTWNDKATHKPLLIPTSTWSQRGRTAIYSPVLLDSTKTNNHAIDLTSFLEKKYGNAQEDDSYKEVKIGTAVMQSARFPYISTPGSLGKGYQFVDAGYIDNLGAGTTIDFLNILEEEMELQDLKKRFKIKIIVINSAEEEPREKESYGKITSPLRSFVNIRNGSHEMLEQDLIEKIDQMTKHGFTISKTDDSLKLNSEYITDSGKKRKHIYPLGWYLSSSAIESMAQRSKEVTIDFIDYSSKDDFAYEYQRANVYQVDSSVFTFERANCGDQLVIEPSISLTGYFEKSDFTNSDLSRLFEEIDFSPLYDAASTDTYQQDLLVASKDLKESLDDDEAKPYKSQVIDLMAYLLDITYKNDNVSVETKGFADGSENPKWVRQYSGKEDFTELLNYSNSDLPRLRAEFQNLMLKSVIPPQIEQGIDFKIDNGVELGEANIPDMRKAETKFIVKKRP